MRCTGPEGVRLGVFPAGHGPHELQGEERKTHRCWLRFTTGDGSEPLPEWLRSPSVAVPDPQWTEFTRAVGPISSHRNHQRADYLRLADSAIAQPDDFEHKREEVDEYGWRNFGDVLADHELAYYKGSRPLVSHYDNQYDIVYGAGLHFLSSANPRWFEGFHDLASHLGDIDIYHTDQDRSAYNHGLFWHTAHDVSADTSTHRTYPASGMGGSGGPSCEHVYANGPALHCWLTGENASRAAVLELA